VKIYEGTRSQSYKLIVTVNGVPLNSRLDLLSENPFGFECGYGGTGAAQLALAILADYLGDDRQALAHYTRFKWDVIVQLPRNGWHLSGKEIDRALRAN
jgi:hypothetical protein